MKSEMRSAVENQLTEYGYALGEDNQILHGLRATGVFLSAKKTRLYAKQARGYKLWSGVDVGDFVAAFWFARKAAASAGGV